MPGIVVVALALGLYVAAYAALCVPEAFRLGFTSGSNTSYSDPLWYQPHYKIGGKGVSYFFWPAWRADVALFPKRWKVTGASALTPGGMPPPRAGLP